MWQEPHLFIQWTLTEAKVTSPRWRHKRPKPLSPCKDQRLDRYLATKAALGELWSFFKRLQRHSGIKDLKTTAQEKKEDSFIVPASSCLPNWHCSSPRGSSPDGENSPHQERKSGVSDELPSPSAAPHGSPASTSPYPDRQHGDVQRWLER